MKNESESAPAIECRNYTFAYNQESPVLHNVSFGIQPGEHTALFGLNGSGKSTLLRSLVGLNRGEGEILIQGIEVIKRNLKAVRRQVGYLFQDPQVQLFSLTVIEDVAFGPANLHGDEELARDQAEQALESVGYRGDLFAPCHTLSLGEMRRVALAGLLALDPAILLLDEPDSFLDKRGTGMLTRLLQDLDDVTLLLVTHNREFATSLCERALLLEDGVLSYAGPIDTAPEE